MVLVLYSNVCDPLFSTPANLPGFLQFYGYQLENRDKPVSDNVNKVMDFRNIDYLLDVTGYCLWARGFSFCVQFSSKKHIRRVRQFLHFGKSILCTNNVVYLSDLCYETYRYKVGCDLPGKYRVALDSDAWEFGGHGRVRDSYPSGVNESESIWG